MLEQADVSPQEKRRKLLERIEHLKTLRTPQEAERSALILPMGIEDGKALLSHLVRHTRVLEEGDEKMPALLIGKWHEIPLQPGVAEMVIEVTESGTYWIVGGLYHDWGDPSEVGRAVVLQVVPLGANCELYAQCFCDEILPWYEQVLAEIEKRPGTSRLTRSDGGSLPIQASEEVERLDSGPADSKLTGRGAGGRAYYSIKQQRDIVRAWHSVKRQGGTSREEFIPQYPNLTLSALASYVTKYNKGLLNED